uniref:Gypsy retrotransposon integrase 1 n=1 Tax=Iconisemion striatum TaxID=60296 RepID=A0A1A7XKF8_9TELE
MTNPCFEPFIMTGDVSLCEGTDENTPVKVKILRDTGASQTLIKEGVLPFSPNSSAGFSVLLTGIELGSFSSPVHQVKLNCPVVSGMVQIAVCKELPIAGIDVLLGNDLARGRVVPQLELLQKPVLQNSEEFESNIYPACVLTRAQRKKDVDITLENTVLHPMLGEEAEASEPEPEKGSEKKVEESNDVFPLSRRN